MPKLDTLPRVINPEEIDIECCLDDTKDDGYGIWLAGIGVKFAPYPVEDVEPAIGTEHEQVEGIDDCRYCRLS